MKSKKNIDKKENYEKENGKCQTNEKDVKTVCIYFKRKWNLKIN